MAKAFIEHDDLEMIRFTIKGSADQQIYAIRSGVKSWQELPVYTELPELATAAGKRYLSYITESDALAVLPVMGRKVLTNGTIQWSKNSGSLNLTGLQTDKVINGVFGSWTNLIASISTGLTVAKSATVVGQPLKLIDTTPETRVGLDAIVRLMGYVPSTSHRVIVTGANLNQTGNSDVISVPFSALSLQAGAKYVIFGGYFPALATAAGVGSSSVAFMIPVVDDGSKYMVACSRSAQAITGKMTNVVDPRYGAGVDQLDEVYEYQLNGTRPLGNGYQTFTWPGTEFYTFGVDPSFYTSLFDELAGLPNLGVVESPVWYPTTPDVTIKNYSPWRTAANKFLIPLLSTPGDVQFFYDAMWPTEVEPTTVWAGMSTGGIPRTVKVYDIELTCVRELYSIPFEWYRDYVSTGFGVYKPLTGEKLTAATGVADTFAGQTVTVAYYDIGVEPPLDIVKQLDIYRTYKKARDKACLSNDFMEKPFSPEVKWGAVDTYFQARLASVHFLYGVRDTIRTAAIAGASTVDYSGLKFKYNESLPSTLTQTGSPQVLLTDPGAVFEALSQGAIFESVYGADDPLKLETHFGADSAGAVASYKELQGDYTAYNAKNSQLTRGRSLATYDFAWESLGVSGFLLYPEMPVQDAYKGIIASEILQKQAGSAMVRAVQSFTTDALASAMWLK
jgi:hypothetical protein